MTKDATKDRDDRRTRKTVEIPNSGILPVYFIYFKTEPRIHVVAIMRDYSDSVRLSNECDAIWGVASAGLRWLKDTRKLSHKLENQEEFYQAIDAYFDDLYGIVEKFKPDV